VDLENDGFVLLPESLTRCLAKNTLLLLSQLFNSSLWLDI